MWNKWWFYDAFTSMPKNLKRVMSSWIRLILPRPQTAFIASAFVSVRTFPLASLWGTLCFQPCPARLHSNSSLSADRPPFHLNHFLTCSCSSTPLSPIENKVLSVLPPKHLSVLPPRASSRPLPRIRAMSTLSFRLYQVSRVMFLTHWYKISPVFENTET